ncbi:MAG: HPr family phosphocarrier protein [Candidatus Omnitrophota bacterium]
MFIKKKITIRNPQGLHARPASIFVQIANKYESDITVKKDDESVNGKSIMGLLVLGANQGSEVELEISGDDAERMMNELEGFLLNENA